MTRTIIEGVYEYCGIQRCGKSTMMVKDMVTRLIPVGYMPDDIFANYRIFIPGVHCLSTEQLIAEVFNMKELKVRHKVISFDEVGQFMLAREYKSKEQTGFVSFAWQMPKRDIVMQYASNVGNSADLILRDATWVTVLPKYFVGASRELDYIESWVSFNYDCRVVMGIVTPGVAQYQALFDSYEPIE